jgi:hypothetical protein
LLVTGRTVVRKMRRLPLKGEVLVRAGQRVAADEVVARALLPGVVQTVRAAEKLGVSPGELARHLRHGVGDVLQVGEVLAETKGFMGMFGSKLESPFAGVIEYISPLTGMIGIREAPTPLVLNAYIAGTVEEILPDEGVVVASTAALVQGIFGVGGERRGALRTVAAGPDAPLDESRLDASCAGCVLLGGATANVSHIRQAISVGAVGLIVGAVSDAVLRAYLGYDIGVAITGQEDVALTVILTEGFGQLSMASRTFRLLDGLQGRMASINGATQIRAGVIRPEIVVPDPDAGDAPGEPDTRAGDLRPGVQIRLIREPYFGRFAEVVSLPPELQIIETEAHVRVAEVRLDNGDVVIVPRANVELLEG